MTPERLEKIKAMAAEGDYVTSPIAYELTEEVQRLNLQNEEYQKLLDECRGFLSHTYACPESPDKFNDAVVDLMSRINAVLLPTEKRTCLCSDNDGNGFSSDGTACPIHRECNCPANLGGLTPHWAMCPKRVTRPNRPPGSTDHAVGLCNPSTCLECRKIREGK